MSLITFHGELHMINLWLFEGFLKYDWVSILVFNATLDNISVAVNLLVDETWVTTENYWPVVSHLQPLSPVVRYYFDQVYFLPIYSSQATHPTGAFASCSNCINYRTRRWGTCKMHCVTPDWSGLMWTVAKNKFPVSTQVIYLFFFSVAILNSSQGRIPMTPSCLLYLMFVQLSSS